MDLNEVTNLSTVVGAAVAVVALVYAALQLRNSVLISRGQFMLELERLVAKHDDVHMKLRQKREYWLLFVALLARFGIADPGAKD